jgi:Transposase DDE domain
LLGQLVANSGRGVRVRSLGGSRAGEMRLTRLLRNPKVTPGEMVAVAAERLGARCAGRHVLAIQDTTVIRSEGGGGLYLHACIGVDASDGGLLGLADARLLSRSAGRRGLKGKGPTVSKQSQRWIDSAARATLACRDAASVTLIADRESDIYAAFAQCPTGAGMVVRAMHDRSLDDGGRLFATVDAMAELGRTELELPAKPGHPARKALLALRSASVEIKRRKGSKDKGLPPCLRLQIVDVREVGGAADGGPADGGPAVGNGAIHWRLLTTLGAEDLARALHVTGLYRRRWLIEQLFRAMKTKGFDIEAVRIGDEAPLGNLATATLIAALCVLQLVHARDGRTEGSSAPLRPVTDAFEPRDLPLLKALSASLEGKTERQKNPHPPDSLAFAAWVCARLGGWTGYYGKPGPAVMLEGWFQFQAAKRGTTAFERWRNV